MPVPASGSTGKAKYTAIPVAKNTASHSARRSPSAASAAAKAAIGRKRRPPAAPIPLSAIARSAIAAAPLASRESNR
jgi:hypothetical protein